MLKLDNIFYATLPSGPINGSDDPRPVGSGQYVVRCKAAAIVARHIHGRTTRQQKRLFKDDLMDSYTIYARNRSAVLLVSH